ncbi:MAG: hypothetical protein V4617_20450 [Gemmatimonadota bacterium]
MLVVSMAVADRAGAQGRWTVRTSPHVDLWLHSFALISADSSPVPLYLRGYRDSAMVQRKRANVLTSLDGNRDALAKRLAESPAYLQAQFLPFQFSSWDEMRGAAEKFLQFAGEPRRAPNQQVAEQVALFAGVFSSPADRDWLRLFLASAQDENARWFASEHSRQLASLTAITSTVDTAWTNSYRAKFERFLNNTSQRNGEMLLSLVIGGEGRAGNGRDRGTVVAVTWPTKVANAREAIVVFAHEVTGSLVGGIVTDNVTPAEQREGIADRYVSIGQTRAGALLLEKIAPELVEPYMRYYLAQAGALVTGDVPAAFSRTFALPKAITDALQRQIDIVLGGI